MAGRMRTIRPGTVGSTAQPATKRALSTPGPSSATDDGVFLLQEPWHGVAINRHNPQFYINTWVIMQY